MQAYQVLLSRSVQYYLAQVISLENSLVEIETTVFESLMDNRVAVRLRDTNGHRFYTEDKLGIVICFNKQDWPMVTLIKEYEI